jgi:hypothetical protein
MNENKIRFENNEQKNNVLDISPNGTASSNPLQFISTQFGNILKKGEGMIHSVRTQNTNNNVDKFQNLYYNGLDAFFFRTFNHFLIYSK